MESGRPEPSNCSPGLSRDRQNGGAEGRAGRSRGDLLPGGGIPWQPRCRLWGTVGLGCGGVAEGRLC